MKIIDEKGRLFGKINVIDFMVISFLFFLVPAFYIGYKIILEQPKLKVSGREFIEIEINCRLIKLKPELLKMISVGEKELDENGEVIGEIISLGQSEPYAYKFDIGEKIIIKEDALLKQVEAKLKLKAEVKQGRPYYKEREIIIGSSLEFKTDKYEITGLLYLKEKWLKFRVKFTGVGPEVARSLLKGDVEKDVFERTIGRIDSILSNEPAMLETITVEGKFVTLNHPFNRDIVVSLDAKCIEKEGAYFYKDYLAKMGNEIVFSATSYSILGMIVGIRIE